jgi:tetratricopeptide (TPR) repeat protein
MTLRLTHDENLQVAELLDGLELPPLSPPPGAAPVDSLAIARAERAVAENRFEDALAELRDTGHMGSQPEVALRATLLESRASLGLGHVDHALRLAQRGHELAAASQFTDVDRADALYHLGCARFKRADISVAVSLLTVALELCNRSDLPCDRLRASILEWRSRCYQNQRDWNAAREDVERALELATALGDSPACAHAYFQASLVAERSGDRLMARFYGEKAETIFRELDDRRMLPRILNNLGGLLFLLEDEVGALLYLDEAMQIALTEGNHADAAQATSSAAQIHLRRDRPELAEHQARNALSVLAGRVDFLDEIGNAQLVLGRALVEQGRYLDADAALRESEAAYTRLGSTSHVAAVWVAQGDLLNASGDCTAGAERYRAAAQSLQDFHF